MYIKGNFQRYHSDMFDDTSSLSLVFLVEEITKQDLINCKNDDSYQIINLIQKKYYDPKLNEWVRLNKL